MRWVLAAALLTVPVLARAQSAELPPQSAPPAAAAGPQQPSQPSGAPGQPPTTQPPAGGATTAAPATASRRFTAPTGLLFNTVRPDKVGDFEKVLGYLQAALAKDTDPTVASQARGWRFFKATEPGPNGTVLYVFQLDPAVSGADYGLGPILAAAYPDTAQLQEIWRLYTGAVTSGGSLLNLTPVTPPPPTASGSDATPPPQGSNPSGLPAGADPTPRMLPPPQQP